MISKEGNSIIISYDGVHTHEDVEAGWNLRDESVIKFADELVNDFDFLAGPTEVIGENVVPPDGILPVVPWHWGVYGFLKRSYKFTPGEMFEFPTKDVGYTYDGETVLQPDPKYRMSFLVNFFGTAKFFLRLIDVTSDSYEMYKEEFEFFSLTMRRILGLKDNLRDKDDVINDVGGALIGFFAHLLKGSIGDNAAVRKVLDVVIDNVFPSGSFKSLFPLQPWFFYEDTALNENIIYPVREPNLPVTEVMNPYLIGVSSYYTNSYNSSGFDRYFQTTTEAGAKTMVEGATNWSPSYDNFIKVGSFEQPGNVNRGVTLNFNWPVLTNTAESITVIRPQTQTPFVAFSGDKSYGNIIFPIFEEVK